MTDQLNLIWFCCLYARQIFIEGVLCLFFDIAQKCCFKHTYCENKMCNMICKQMTTTHRFVTAISPRIIQIHTHTHNHNCKMRFFSTLRHNEGNCASKNLLLLLLNQCKRNNFALNNFGWLNNGRESWIFPIHIYCDRSSVFRSVFPPFSVRPTNENNNKHGWFSIRYRMFNNQIHTAHLHTENNKIEANRMKMKNQTT